MWWVYILQSESSGRFYIGITSRMEGRLEEHNSGQAKSTRSKGPWKLVYSETFPTRAQANQRERQLKSWKSHRSIEELIDQA